jgi:putative ABC transport system permease protein
VLAAIGVYGVISYAAQQRLPELGVRLALGATRRDVLRLVLRDGLLLTASGALIGLAGAFWATRLLRRLLFGVESWHAPTFVGPR